MIGWRNFPAFLAACMCFVARIMTLWPIFDFIIMNCILQMSKCLRIPYTPRLFKGMNQSRIIVQDMIGRPFSLSSRPISF